MDDRLVLNRVKTALELLTAQEMQAAGNTFTAEAEIAGLVMGPLFKMLRDAYNMMIEINEIWTANQLGDKITAAAMDQRTLAGYSPATWITLGATLPQIMAAINAEFEIQLPDGTVQTVTPKQILMRRYTLGE